MCHYHEKRAASIVVFCTAIFAFASFLAPPLAAQQTGRADTMSAADRMRQRQLRRNEQMDTGLMIGALEKESRRRPTEEDRPRLDYMRIKEDFERIQTVNNQMMVTTFANNVLDYKRIAEASSEIRKRATRLHATLPLPESENQEQSEQPLKGWNELDQGEVKPALKALDDLIMGFVNNPVFQKPEIVDVQQSSKAKRDLEVIIKLSGKIKKSAEKLSKDKDH
jgi:hypothetical protein